MEFRLKSNYQPMGDQPQAIEKLVASINSNQPHQTLLGVTGSGKTFTLANVIQKVQKPTLIISHNKTLAAQLYQEFRDFFPDNAVSYFVSYYDYYQPESYLPATDTYIEKETDINDEIDKLRLSTTANLLTRKDVIVVASVSCIYNLGSPVEYGRNVLELIEGQLIDRETIGSRLVDMQYTRNDFELKRGCFRVRGDTLFIWPADSDYVLRLNFLEKLLESISKVDPRSSEKVEDDVPLINPDGTRKPKRFTLYPAKHFQSGQQDTLSALAQIEHDLKVRLVELKQENKVVEAYRLAQRVQHDIDMIREVGYVNGIENYSRYFDGRDPGDPPFSLLDYFHFNAGEFGKDPNDFLTIIDESHITLPQLRGMFAGDRSRKQTLIDYGFRLPSALDNRPLTYPEILERVPQHIYASATPNDYELDLSRGHVAEQLIRPTGLVDPDIEIRKTNGQIADLIREIMQRKANGQRVLVTTITKRTAEALTEYLNDPKEIAKAISGRVDGWTGGQVDENINNSKSTTSLPSYPSTNLKVQYLHADVHTLDRSDILDDLRKGEYDVLVGINLLREGLDLPEVSLVAILEADKEGFLRSKSSLIQVMGRAARHADGHVIMYADKVTPSMKGAIEEVNRRRNIQETYNKEHGITPATIAKPIREKLLVREPEANYESEVKHTRLPKTLHQFGWKHVADVDPVSLTPKDKKSVTKELTRLMNAAAKQWDFELAAKYRDMIKQLE